MHYRETYCDGYEYFCEFCAHDNAEKTANEIYVDSPIHCSICHCPLDYDLTQEGIDYILDAMKESLRKGKMERNKIHSCYDGTYYENSRHCEIVRDWAEKLQSYGLEWKIERFVELYLERTEN